MAAHTVNRAFIKEKSTFFADMQVWPLQTRLDPEGWLRNFKQSEENFAVHLLNGFSYYSNAIVDQLFVEAFRRLSSNVVPHSSTASEARYAWNQFLDEVVVTYPTGEIPSPADSGHLFARRARDLIAIPEDRVLSPEEALIKAQSSGTSAVVFVDDFVGSGSQFRTTWERPYGPSADSFDSLSGSIPQCYYIPLFCTQFALQNTLAGLSPKISCIPLHELGDEYSALSNPSVFWPSAMASDGPEFVKTVSQRIGLPNTGGHETTDWQGFSKLGMGLAFEHQIPDACLPMFYTTVNDWRPLWRRA